MKVILKNLFNLVTMGNPPSFPPQKVPAIKLQPDDGQSMHC